MGKPRKKDRKNKINLIFDEGKRKDFLCGFRKRKLERKKKAQEELHRLLKEEKKRIKQENKESYKKLVVSSRPIPDIEQLLNEEYEDENVNVRVVELSNDTLQKNNVIIGENKAKEEIKKYASVPNKKVTINEDLPGMNTDTESEQDENEQSETETNDSNLKSKQEIKKMLKKQATTQIKKSKVFQMKNKLEQIKNKKKSQQKKARMKRADPRKDKAKKKSGKRKH